MANTNTWTVALTFTDEDEKTQVQEAIRKEAALRHRSPSSFITLLVLHHVHKQTEDISDSR